MNLLRHKRVELRLWQFLSLLLLVAVLTGAGASVVGGSRLFVKSDNTDGDKVHVQVNGSDVLRVTRNGADADVTLQPVGAGTMTINNATITGTTAISATTGTYSALLTAQNGFTLSGGTLTLPNDSVTDAMVVNALTIDAGTIDDTPVGGTTPNTGAFTNLSASGSVNFPADSISDGEVVDALTIDGGSVDGSPVGGTTPDTGSFTDLSASGLISFPNDSITDAMVSNTLTASDLVAAGSVVADSEVDNDLTISGGVINSTPIGATTRSTGAFTTLAANGTVTLTGTTLNAAALTSITLGTGGAATIGIGGPSSTTTLQGTLAIGNVRINSAAANSVSVSTGDLLLDAAASQVVQLRVSSTPILTASSTFGVTVANGVTINTNGLTVTAGAIDTPLGPGNLRTNGTGVLTVGAIDLSTPDVAGILPLLRGGLGVDASSVAGNLVFAGTAGPAGFRLLTDPDIPNVLTLTAGTSISDAAITGGTIDGTPIGATTAAAGTFSVLNVTGATLNAASPTAVSLGTSNTNTNINLGNGSGANNLSIAGAASTTTVNGTVDFTGSVTFNGSIAGAASMTLGSAVSAPGSLVLHDNNATAFTGTLQTAATLTVDRTYTLPDRTGVLAVADGVLVTNLNAQFLSGSPSSSFARLTAANTFTNTNTFSGTVTANSGITTTGATNLTLTPNAGQSVVVMSPIQLTGGITVATSTNTGVLTGDYAVFVNNNVTLPDATLETGRVIVVREVGGASRTVTSAAVGNQMVPFGATAPAATDTVLSGGAATYVSDGTNWYRITP